MMTAMDDSTNAERQYSDGIDSSDDWQQLREQELP